MADEIQLQLGLEVLRSYKRLSYTPWHAMAEFIDNSLQSYLSGKNEIDAVLSEERQSFEVRITFEKKNGGTLRIADNAMGMSKSDLQAALRVGFPPADTSGLSQYGMGLKTSATWFGQNWRIVTKKLGHDTEYEVDVDVESVANGAPVLPCIERHVEDTSSHYTLIEIKNLNHLPHTRTVTKIQDFLGSMYRIFLRDGLVRIWWNETELRWEDEYDFLTAMDGSSFKSAFEFEVNGKSVSGWVGVLRSGSRAKAGFSQFRRSRMVRGYPDSWRPEQIFGQLLGSNDLVNQRIVGEIHLDQFEVSHTKDDILWADDEEDLVGKQLAEISKEYRTLALTFRKRGDSGAGPSDLAIKAAVDELQSELNSEEIVDLINIDVTLPAELVTQAMHGVMEGVDQSSPDIYAKIETTWGTTEIIGILADTLSASDPYVVSEATSPFKVLVAINMQHPYLQRISGSDPLLNYFRECVYDAVAEWQARNKSATIDPDTIKNFKDKLLRIGFEVEMHN